MSRMWPRSRPDADPAPGTARAPARPWLRKDEPAAGTAARRTYTGGTDDPLGRADPGAGLVLPVLAEPAGGRPAPGVDRLSPYTRWLHAWILSAPATFTYIAIFTAFTLVQQTTPPRLIDVLTRVTAPACPPASHPVLGARRQRPVGREPRCGPLAVHPGVRHRGRLGRTTVRPAAHHPHRHLRPRPRHPAHRPGGAPRDRVGTGAESAGPHHRRGGQLHDGGGLRRGGAAHARLVAPGQASRPWPSESSGR